MITFLIEELLDYLPIREAYYVTVAICNDTCLNRFDRWAIIETILRPYNTSFQYLIRKTPHRDTKPAIYVLWIGIGDVEVKYYRRGLCHRDTKPAVVSIFKIHRNTTFQIKCDVWTNGINNKSQRYHYTINNAINYPYPYLSLLRTL